MDLQAGAQAPAWLWDVGPSAVRDFGQGAEDIGLDFVFVTDHVLFAYPLQDRPAVGYSGAVAQHEALTFLSFLAACTRRVALATAVLVLPQREPVLVAKQAAEISVLSEGRLRLGLGAGWSETEFGALGASLRGRGARLEEGVEVMRACWSREPVTFEGRFTVLREMSFLPKPVPPPLVMFGGSSPPAEERAARIGDGWMGMGFLRPDAAAEQIARLHGHLRQAGRDPASFPIQWTTALRDPERTSARLHGYRDAGASWLGVSIPEREPMTVDGYLKALEEFWHDARRDLQKETR
jgi:probable F420-dependent oxidoreductase